MASFKSKVLHSVGNSLFKYIYKNPRRNMLKLVKLGKVFAGKMYPESTFTKPIEIITDKTNIWHEFLFRGIDEVNHDLLRRAVLRSEEHTSELQSLKRISYAVSLIGRAHV